MGGNAGQSCPLAGTRFYRFDGTMYVKKRDQNLKDFKTHDGSCTLLISLKCGSLCLNITEAILLDPWWSSQVYCGFPFLLLSVYIYRLRAKRLTGATELAKSEL